MMLYCFNKNVCFVALDPNAVSMLCIAYSLFLFIIKKVTKYTNTKITSPPKGMRSTATSVLLSVCLPVL